MQRTALVTGAGRGIGRAVAVRLAVEGYAVGLTARSPDQLAETAALVEAAGGRAVAAPGDVTDRGDVAAVHRRVTGALGPVDVLVNNAGYASRPMPFAEIDPADWWQVVETNVLGAVHFCHEVVPAMAGRGGGHVVNVNSMQGSKVVGASIAYGVSKAALMRFTESLAAELEEAGVVVLDVSPGLVRTGMTADRPDLDRLPPEAWSSPEAVAEKIVTLVSGRYDGLSGRFVKLGDDLDQLLARASDDVRILRMVP